MIVIYISVGLCVALSLIGYFTSKFNDPYRDIFFIMGLPGSGKTTYMVKQILRYKRINEKLIEKGKQPWSIYVDFPVNIDGVRLFNPLDLASCWPDKKSVMFIDEISLTWDARNFKKFDSGVSEFMKLHRHAEVVVYCASQNFDCDKRVRDLCTHFCIVKQLFHIFVLLRPVKVIFPIFTEPDAEHGSSITSGYEYYKIWKWRLYYTPSCFPYFYTRLLPERTPLPYTVIDVPEQREDNAKSKRRRPRSRSLSVPEHEA